MDTSHRAISATPATALRAGFAHYVSLPDRVWKDIRGRWQTCHFQKDTLLTAPPTVESRFYFVLSGVQRLYYLSPEGNEVVLGFTFQGNFSGVYDSFVQQTPARCYLQALTDSELLAIGIADMNELFDRHACVDRWGRLFAQDILFGRVQREVELSTRTAEERYRDFIRRSPDPLRQIPQKHLASYLNMTPETFSRLRASASLRDIDGS